MDAPKVPKAKGIIKFNVGGETTIAASLDILMKHPESKLAQLIYGDDHEMIDDKIFIDRDPETFKLVINFLRYDKCPKTFKDEN
jgi:hypothetical protein